MPELLNLIPPQHSCYNILMIKFSGSHQDFGIIHGQYLRAAHHNFYTRYNPATLRRQLSIYQKFYPELILEITSAAKVIGLDPNLLLYEDIASFVDNQKRRINQRTHGCTIFAVHEKGRTFVGRNYDWKPAAREFFEQYDLNFTNGYRHFLFSDEGVYGRHLGKNTRKLYAEDAVNEHGLYVGLTYAHIDKWSYGLSPSHFIRYIAEHCRTTRQALNAFKRIPCAIPKNFLIADAKGDLAVVEHAAKKFAILRPDEWGTARPSSSQPSAPKLIVQTNHCLAPSLKPLDRVTRDNPTANTFLRYEEAKHLVEIQLPGFQFTDIWRILRRSHYVYSDETIWSLALELSEPRLNLYYDTALGQKQEKFSF